MPSHVAFEVAPLQLVPAVVGAVMYGIRARGAQAPWRARLPNGANGAGTAARR